MSDYSKVTMPTLFDVGSHAALHEAKEKISKGEFGNVRVISDDEMDKYQLKFSQAYRPQSRKVEIALFGEARALGVVRRAYEFDRPGDEFDPVYDKIFMDKIGFVRPFRTYSPVSNLIDSEDTRDNKNAKD